MNRHLQIRGNWNAKTREATTRLSLVRGEEIIKQPVDKDSLPRRNAAEATSHFGLHLYAAGYVSRLASRHRSSVPRPIIHKICPL